MELPILFNLIRITFTRLLKNKDQICLPILLLLEQILKGVCSDNSFSYSDLVIKIYIGEPLSQIKLQLKQ